MFVSDCFRSVVLLLICIGQLEYNIIPTLSCQHLFYIFLTERRRRDLNPRAAINDLLPFQGSPFNLLGTSPKAIKKRRGWDSNPCALSDKRFSRPPRYDHFDTSPLRIAEYNHSALCDCYFRSDKLYFIIFRF